MVGTLKCMIDKIKIVFFYSHLFIISLKYTRPLMTDNNLYWESKISFFSKFLGYDNIEDF